MTNTQNANSINIFMCSLLAMEYVFIVGHTDW